MPPCSAIFGWGRQYHARGSLGHNVCYYRVFSHILLNPCVFEAGEYRDLIEGTTLIYGETRMETNTGVPQGSILSPPMMFNLYVCGILKRLGLLGEVWAYADNIIIGMDTHMIPAIEQERRARAEKDHTASQ